MAIDTDSNKAFVERYRKFAKNPKAVTHHALESSYFQVYPVGAGGGEGQGGDADPDPQCTGGAGIRRARAGM